MASIITRSNQQTIPRPAARFPPDIWGNRFINCNAQDYSENLEGYVKEIAALREEVRAKLMENSITRVEKMKLIDAFERPRVSYHYEKDRGASRTDF
ncbi:hypothetical protein Ancab_034094 [Ancistrocladus abbreviatus]